MRKEMDLIPMNLQFFAEGEGEGDSANTEAVAEPQTEPVSTSEPDGTEGVTEEPADPQPKGQSPEANAAFAEMRRRAEAAERKNAEIDAIFAQQYGGFTNPETGQPIRGAKDYYEAVAAQERMKVRSEMQEKGVDPQLIDNMIANSPLVRESRQAVAELNNIRAQQQLDADFNQILALDPTLGSKDDILNDPAMPLIVQKVQSGMSLVDAYKIVNFEKLSSSREAAAKQATINQVKGKSHLATGTSLNVNEEGEDIPAELQEMYKDAFPDKTPQERRALYNKALNTRRK